MTQIPYCRFLSLLNYQQKTYRRCKLIMLMTQIVEILSGIFKYQRHQFHQLKSAIKISRVLRASSVTPW